MTTAVISDLHVPFVDKKAFNATLSIIKEEGVKQIVIAGDFCDCEAVSKFSKPLKKRDFSSEIAIAKHYIDIISRLQLQTIFIIGNHENFIYKYICDKASELSMLPELEIRNLLAMPKSWKVIPFNQHVIINGVIVRHGAKYSNNVLDQNLNMGVSSLQGHSHRLSLKHKRLFDGRIITAGETGCLCSLDADYNEHNNWCHGMALIEDNGFVRIIRL